MTEESAVLSVSGLSVGFSRDPAAFVLRDISFSVARGSLAIVGASAAGKSTLLRAMIGLLPQGARVAGRVHLPHAGELSSVSPEQLRAYRRRSLGVVWQDPVGSLIPGVPVDKQLRRAIAIRRGQTNRRWSAKASRNAAEVLLRRVGFEDPAKEVVGKTPAMLSGGMCQRCCIALALAAPDLHLLIGDEPIASLDAVSAAQVLDLLFSAHRERQSIFVMVTHDIRLARRFDRVAVMDKGRIVEYRASAEFFAGPKSDAGRALLGASRSLEHGRAGNSQYCKETIC